VSYHKSMKYVLDIQSEHNYISNMCYSKYQLYVSATTLAIIRLYSTYQVAVQCMWCILGRRDLVYNSSGMNSNLIDWLKITEIKYTIFWHVTKRIMLTNQNMYNQLWPQNVVWRRGNWYAPMCCVQYHDEVELFCVLMSVVLTK